MMQVKQLVEPNPVEGAASSPNPNAQSPPNPRSGDPMAPPPPPPPPELMDDVTAEILLRLPPDEPELLFRAALVCKPWLRVLCDPAFLRRYRAFHGAPPLLGVLHRFAVVQGDPAPVFTPTTAVPPFHHPGADCRRSRDLDCRHGRVLFHVMDDGMHLVVWDPVTGDRHRVPEVDIDWMTYTAAVLCAVPGCDHLDCNGGPFLVVFVATDDGDELIKASVYSSETSAWSVPASVDNGGWRSYQIGRNYVQPRRGTLIGDEIFFTIARGTGIVKYHWGNNCLSLIKPPPPAMYDNMVTLMVMDDGSLGFIGTADSSLHLWSRKVNLGADAEWVQCRVIELETVIPMVKPHKIACVAGFAEGLDLVFVSTNVGLFAIELKSGRVKKIDEPGTYYAVLPYMSFYTPDRGILSSLGRTYRSLIRRPTS
ncbi:hypothetical protein ACP70R_014561 [Stipagrostis hirtigluma subsp. patula]